MKTLFALVLLASCLSSLTAIVMIRDGEYEFSLEVVKQLWALMDQETVDTPQHPSSHTSLCKNPKLPEVFQAVCTSSDAPQVFLRLKEIAEKADICEICGYAACTGC